MKIVKVTEDTKINIELNFSEWMNVFGDFGFKVVEGSEIGLTEEYGKRVFDKYKMEFEKLDIKDTEMLILRGNALNPMFVDRLRKLICDMFKKRVVVIHMGLESKIENLNPETVDRFIYTIQQNREKNAAEPTSKD